MGRKSFYAASFKDGRREVYSNWTDCKAATSGVSGVLFRGFSKRFLAIVWLAQIDNPKVESEVPEVPKHRGTVIYVDGSFSPRCKKAGWAWIAIEDGKVIDQEYGVTEQDALSRNIDGELEAAIKAMEWASRKQRRITICHDYNGISKWANGEWRVKAEVSKAYVRKIKDMLHLVHFRKVKGHSGERFNDMVDKLASRAISEYMARKRLIPNGTKDALDARADYQGRSEMEYPRVG